MRRLILAGGGDAVASRPLDAQLAAWLPLARPMLYLPVAMNGAEPTYDACLAWVTSVFAPLGVADIVMWTDLAGKTVDDLRPFGAVYIGGGNTFRLLHALRTTGVDHALVTYIAEGGIVYGGSAGAIVLGADITTAAHADPNTVGLRDTRGLDLVDGCSIWCHYDPTQATHVETYACDRALTVIALPEDAGIVVEGAAITALGTAPVVVFAGTAHVTVAPSSIVVLPPPRACPPVRSGTPPVTFCRSAVSLKCGPRLVTTTAQHGRSPWTWNHVSTTTAARSCRSSPSTSTRRGRPYRRRPCRPRRRTWC